MARAIAALRIAGSLALGQRVAQMHPANGADQRIGQIEVRSGVLRGKRVLLSAPTTPAALLSGIENGNGTSRATLQPILDALQMLSARGLWTRGRGRHHRAECGRRRGRHGRSSHVAAFADPV